MKVGLEIFFAVPYIVWVDKLLEASMSRQTLTQGGRGDELSASLEDYLEAIFHIVARKQAARAKDIAERVGVNRSSVTGALHALSDRGLVNYAPYDVVTLTEPGRLAAADVVRRHEVLRDFLERVLGVEAGQAEQAACRMEHAAPRDVIERLVAFADFVETCPRAGADWTEAFVSGCVPQGDGDQCAQCLDRCLAKGRQDRDDRQSVETRPKEARDEEDRAPADETLMLTAAEPGREMRVSAIHSGSKLKARLAAMGLLPGVKIEIIGRPTKGPLIVSVMGGRLMLGREMAEKIAVRPAK